MKRMNEEGNAIKKSVAEHISRRISQARGESHLKQGELGREIGVSTKQISFYENKINTPPIDRLVMISRATGKPVSFFIDFDESDSEAKDSRKDQALSRLRYIQRDIRKIIESIGSMHDEEDSSDQYLTQGNVEIKIIDPEAKASEETLRLEEFFRSKRIEIGISNDDARTLRKQHRGKSGKPMMLYVVTQQPVECNKATKETHGRTRAAGEEFSGKATEVNS